MPFQVPAFQWGVTLDATRNRDGTYRLTTSSDGTYRINEIWANVR